MNIFYGHYVEKKAFFVYFWLFKIKLFYKKELYCKNRHKFFALPVKTWHTCAKAENRIQSTLKIFVRNHTKHIS